MSVHRMIRHLCLAVAAAFTIALSASAEVKLPAVFSNHMVLQHYQRTPVFGWAAPCEEVQVLLDGNLLAKGKANEQGEWKVELLPHAAGGPHKLVVEGSDSRLQVDDVYFGEVWICSGQSNMAMRVGNTTNAKEKIAEAAWPKIRMFTVPRKPADKPQNDCDGKWQVCSPDTVSGFSAAGYFFARELHRELDMPVGMLHASWGGTLAEAWTSLGALEAKEELRPIVERIETTKEHKNRASHLYNGMLCPLMPYGIRGAIWYQGESNVGRAAQYATLFSTMIRDWRAKWSHGNFPFYFVQLAPFHYDWNDSSELCAELWDSQFKTLRGMSNTGMVVTTDIAMLDDIHPKNKQDVGKRLALWALSETYGRTDVTCSGPLYRSHKVVDGKLQIHFNYAVGLATRDGEPLNEFTIAGEDQQFVPAQAKIDGNKIVVWSDDVPEPAAVRMGWRNTAQPNLINAASLPASPFRTDDWPLQTADRY